MAKIPQMRSTKDSDYLVVLEMDYHITKKWWCIKYIPYLYIKSDMPVCSWIVGILTMRVLILAASSSMVLVEIDCG